MNLENFKKHSDWVKVWSGKWSIHSCSQFGGEWTEVNRVSNDPAYMRVVYVSRKGISDCWVSQMDKDNLGARLMAEIHNDPENVKKFAEALKFQAGKVLSFIKRNASEEIGLELYNQFWRGISDYYLPHLSVKYIVDYLLPDELEKYLPILEDARLYSEPVFREEENFMEHIADQVEEKTGVATELVLSTTKDELRKFYGGSALPKKSLLTERFNESVQLFESGKCEIFSGKQAVEMEKIVLPKDNQKEIRGQNAYCGRVKGRVRIVIDPFKYAGSFEKGDILVSGMTRPEFLPLMEKAAAFVTDAGGILSHAAIVAREMKKPCIIGTKIATKVLKDGDVVEVDAERGVVTILERSGEIGNNGENRDGKK